jgi:glycosyltransferase involved in cell wall biosynthesis
LRVAHQLRRSRKACDVIHFHGINLWALPALLVGRRLNKGIVVKVATLGQDDPVGLSRERAGKLKSRLFELPDAIVGNSPGIHQAFAGHRAAGRVRVILNGIDTQQFAPADRDGRRSARIRLGLPLNRKIAVCTAAVVPRKDIDFLLDVWRSLELALPPLLVVVGPTHQVPRYFRRISHRVDEQGMDGQVFFTGCVSDVAAYLQASDVFVFASTGEGLPSAVIEAMGCGLPCVVRRIPGVTDILIGEGRDGFVLELTDVTGFAGVVQALLTSPNLGAEMGTRARETVLNRFSADVMVEHYLKLYRTVLAAHRL